MFWMRRLRGILSSLLEAWLLQATVLAAYAQPRSIIIPRLTYRPRHTSLPSHLSSFNFSATQQHHVVTVCHFCQTCTNVIALGVRTSLNVSASL
jgi:hypothetical protein